MHLQRLVIIPPALLGMLAVALPWVTDSLPEGEVLQRGFEFRLGWLPFACFALSLALVFASGIKEKLNTMPRVVCMLLAVLAIGPPLLTFWQYSSLAGAATAHRELMWPGFGTWLTMASAVVLLLATLFLGRLGTSAPATVAKEPS